MKCSVLTAGVLFTATTAMAGSVITFDDSLSAGVVIGSGISNSNFAVSTDASGVQIGIKAHRRFLGELSNTDNRYFANTGESPTSGMPGAMADPGTLVWNYLYSVDLGASGLTFADVLVDVTIDFDPSAGTDLASFELVSALGAGGIDITGDTLFQDSQNLGFGFWAVAFGVDAVDPFEMGEYTMMIEVTEVTGAPLGAIDMVVDVRAVPLPSGGVLGAAGLGLIAGVRRRR